MLVIAGHNFRISPLSPSKILTLDTPDPEAPCVFGPVANNTSAGFRSLINHPSGDILLGVPLLDMMSRKCEMTPNWVQLVGCSERLVEFTILHNKNLRDGDGNTMQGQNHFFPTCQVKVVRFYVSWPPPPSPPPHPPPPPPQLNCKLVIAVVSSGPQLQALDRSGPPRAWTANPGSAGPYLQARDRAGPRRTWTASPGSEWSPAGPRLQALDRSGPGKARAANPGSEWSRPDLNCKPPPDLNHKESLKIYQIECQKECQRECQKECQNECLKRCQIECQNRCEIECQKKRQNICHKVCQKKNR